VDVTNWKITWTKEKKKKETKKKLEDEKTIEATYRKRQMPGNQKHRVLEMQGVVDIVVVDNNTTAEDNPNGDDSSCAELRAGTGLLLVVGYCWRREFTVVVAKVVKLNGGHLLCVV